MKSTTGPKPPTRPGTYPTAHTCHVCKEGKLVEVFAYQTHHDPLMRRSAYMKRMGVHCALCGVAYGKLPEETPYMPADGVVREEHVEGRHIDLTATTAELAAEDRVNVCAAPTKKRSLKLTERDFLDRVEDIFDQLGEGVPLERVSADLMNYVAGNLGRVEGHGIEGLRRRVTRRSKP